MSFQSPPRSPATSPKREDKNEHPRVVLGGGVGWDPANYPARDPKECVAVRILKGKAERIIKNGVHSRWSLEEEMLDWICRRSCARSP